MAENMIEIESGISAFSGKPFCAIRWGKEKGQLTPDEVRALALGWLSAAEAAEGDAMIMDELRESVGLDFQTAGTFLLSLRKRRNARGA